MKNESCKEISNLLSCFIDKELSGKEEKKVIKHLENCASCSKEYAELLELKKLMEEVKKEELQAPEGFVESVMGKISEEDSPHTQEGKIHKFFKPLFIKSWIPAVIAAMLLVVIYIPGANDLKSEDKSSRMMSQESFTAMGESAPQEASSVDLEFNNASDQRKIIRNGYISSDVANYRETEKEIINETEELGGYVAGSNSYYYGENQDLLAGNINLRIPEKNFDQMIIFLEGKGKTVSENMASSDVTEEFLDLSARIKNLKIKEERLLAILNKQGELKELLEVENEIAQTRSEIESLEGRLNLLNNQVSFSEINVNLREVKNLEDSISKDSLSGIGSKIKESIIKSVNMILDLGVKGIILISSALPFLLILIILYFVFRKIWNKKNRDL